MGKRTTGWARDHDRCRSCGTTDRPHRAKGFCARCYNQALNDRLRQPDARQGRRRGGLSLRLTKQELRQLYVEQELSLQEIAEKFGCTRVMILYLMKRHSIPRRSHSEARRNAQREGKVKYMRRLATGEMRVIKPRRTSINERFFRRWSPEMAYVLGVFYTDGCLHMTRTGYYGVLRHFIRGCWDGDGSMNCSTSCMTAFRNLSTFCASTRGSRLRKSKTVADSGDPPVTVRESII